MQKDPIKEKVQSKDLYFLQNVFGISAVEFFWGLGLPVVVESTFLQLFLKKIGASNLAIGLIPTFFFIGSSIFALMSSYVTEPLIFKRKAVILLHLVCSVSLLLFGGALFLLNTSDYLLILFFLCYGIFCICIGMTLPVWLSYLVNILSEKKSVTGLAYMNILQNMGKLISSILILKFVEAYAFSMQSSALIFLLVGVLFGIGSLFFFFTKELPSHHSTLPAEFRSFYQYFIKRLAHILGNRNVLFFMMSDLELYVVITVISFYANYATIYCDINPAIAAGLFVTCIYLGAISSNLIMGSWGCFTLRNKSLVSKLISMFAIMLLIVYSDQWSFLLSSFLLGAARGTRLIIMPPAVKKLSGLTDATSYFALLSIFTLPVAMGLPMTAGYFLDYFSNLGQDAYRLIFGVAVGLILMTLFFLFKVDFDGKN